MFSLWFSAVALMSFSSISFSQSIDPNSVTLADRTQWCTSQIAQCPLICLQEAGNNAGTNANDCDIGTLAFNCVCSNGLSPNASEYSQTIPYYICTRNNENCVASCGLNNNACASSCREDNPCGAQDPERVNTSTISTMSATATSEGAASTASDGAVYTGFGGGDSSATDSPSSENGSSDNGSSRLILQVGELYGLGLVAAGIFLGFSTLL